MIIYSEHEYRSRKNSFTKKLKVLLDWLIIRQYELYRVDSLRDEIVITKNSKQFATISIEGMMDAPIEYIFELIEWKFSKLEGSR